MGIKISGIGSYVPEKILTNFDLEKIVDTSDEWIRTRTGIEQRRVAADDQATSDLAYEAARKALEMAKLDASELDAIIVASISVDHIFPSTACILQQKIGAVKAFCFDLEAACSGLIYSTEVATSLLRANDKYNKILVLGAEKLTSEVNWEDRNTCVLFGDGAAAMILEKDASNECCILASDLGADGSYKDILQIPAGGSRLPASEKTIAEKQHYIQMEGRDVFKLAVNAMVNSCKKVMAETGITADQIKWLVPHQANYRILKAVAQRLRIPEDKVYMNVNRFGNTSAASIGLCLDEIARGNYANKGDYVLLTAFGGGLTWGSILLKW
ncbi:MAG: ketoacyl-ACP synthase III [Lentisphaerae bacterium]|nr:ketoacyl-ACP synthase III [Lentisphaerota bacterium]MCP4101168.1 ketoacyl-ACP synthase III [Lentisphaerota bacterium]